MTRGRGIIPVIIPLVCLCFICRTASADETAPPIVPPRLQVPAFPDRTFSVAQFGATGQGRLNETAAINKAIEACSAAGGGTVHFPAGTYLAASIHLQSNVQLTLDKDAVIVGDKQGFDPPEPNPWDKYQDFGHSHFHNALLWGEDIENVAITGGRINGGGIISGDPKPGGGDKVIAVKSGRNLHFHDILHETGGHFVYLLNNCENLTLDHLTVKRSRDGVDLMGCRNVRMHDCRFTGCGDDTLGIKSDYVLGRKILSEHIYAWDCYFETGCNGVQFGSETAGDFRDIKAWNIRIGRAAKAGIGITCNDGGIIDGVEFRDFAMQRASNPIFMIVTDRLRTGEKDAKVGSIRNVRIANVTATDMVPGQDRLAHPCTLSGLPGHPIENVWLENIRITYAGGGMRDLADRVPPYSKQYQPRVLGQRPASGLYARHVKGLKLRNVQFRFEAPDRRPPLSFVDIDALTLDGFQSEKPADIEMMRAEQVRELVIRNSPGLPDTQGRAIEKDSLGR